MVTIGVTRLVRLLVVTRPDAQLRKANALGVGHTPHRDGGVVREVRDGRGGSLSAKPMQRDGAVRHRRERTRDRVVLPEADLQLRQLSFGLPDGFCGSITLIYVI